MSYQVIKCPFKYGRIRLNFLCFLHYFSVITFNFYFFQFVFAMRVEETFAPISLKIPKFVTQTDFLYIDEDFAAKFSKYFIDRRIL